MRSLLAVFMMLCVVLLTTEFLLYGKNQYLSRQVENLLESNEILEKRFQDLEYENKKMSADLVRKTVELALAKMPTEMEEACILVRQGNGVVVIP